MAPSLKPFRFGLQMHGPFSDMSWLDSARKVEDLGFDTLFMPDHFTEQYSPISALSAAAAVTTRINVGTLVFGNDYRHPVVLAKEIATLDNIAEGRVEFGLGAGWMRTDYDQAGMTYDRPGVRIERMEEALQVIRGCWSNEEFSFSGEHFTIDGYTGFPAPHTPGGPRLIIGGGGPRMLGVAARNGDIVGVTANLRAGEVGPDAIADSHPDAYDAKIARVQAAADGRDVELSSLTMTSIVTDDRAASLSGIAEMFGWPVEVVQNTPALLVGSVDEICNTLMERRERWGFSYVVVQDDDHYEAFAQVVDRLSGS